MTTCQVCGSDVLDHAIDFGRQPISNRFLRDRNEEEELFPLVLGQCAVCSAVQQFTPPPADQLRPRYSGVTYSEPEGHLDTLTRTIVDILGDDRRGLILGLSSKDDSLVARFKALGFSRTHRLDPALDLDVHDVNAGIETIQDRLIPERARAIVERLGRAQVVVARHLIEHGQRLPDLLEAIRILLAPGGYSVIEVPDCSACFARCDYTTVWEERVHYFTPAIFSSSVFRHMRQSPIRIESHPSRPEGLLVGIGRSDENFLSSKLDAESNFKIFRNFTQQFSGIRRRAAHLLNGSGSVAVMGAGHLACAFINYLGLANQIDFVVDDNPTKQGLYMPGSRLPIKSSAALLSENIRVCLLSVNPIAEERVIARNQAFMDSGGRFASIFASSDRYFLA
jgi:hypothetical protein